MIRDSDWQVLVDKIRRGQCTPFLGAGLSEPHVPLGSEFSARLATDFGYPLPAAGPYLVVTASESSGYDTGRFEVAVTGGG